MKKHMLVALGTALVLAGVTLADTPDRAAPVVSGQVPSQEGVLFPAAGEASCSPGGQCWATAEYLLGWFQGDKVGVLVTTSPPDTSPAIAGIPGLSTTRILFGGDTVNTGVRSGLRLGAGYWFTPERILGVEAGFMFLESRATLFEASSDGSVILTRPFVDALTGASMVHAVAFPNTPETLLPPYRTFPGSGTVAVRLSSGNYYEAHVDMTENINDLGWLRVDSLFGYHYFRYAEALHIRQTKFPTGPDFVPGTQIVNIDDFGTRNDFHGGDFGLRAQFFWGDLSLALLGKLAVGQICRLVDIEGGQLVSVPGTTPVASAGGMLALVSNIEHHSDQDWTILPELGITLGWQAAPNLRLSLGYTMLYLNRIARAADQVDYTLNPDLLPPALQPPVAGDHPLYSRNRADVWLHSLSFGLEVSY
jgi:hypothetical protein